MAFPSIIKKKDTRTRTRTDNTHDEILSLSSVDVPRRVRRPTSLSARAAGLGVLRLSLSRATASVVGYPQCASYTARRLRTSRGGRGCAHLPNQPRLPPPLTVTGTVGFAASEAMRYRSRSWRRLCTKIWHLLSSGACNRNECNGGRRRRQGASVRERASGSERQGASEGAGPASAGS